MQENLYGFKSGIQSRSGVILLKIDDKEIQWEKKIELYNEHVNSSKTKKGP